MKTTTFPLKPSMNRTPYQLGLLLIPLALACFALAPQARATCQDACLTNNNTVQGDDALINNTTGDGNTAIGFNALAANTSGDNNNAVGSEALSSNTEGFDNVAQGTDALKNNTGGFINTAIGHQAMLSNTTGIGNTAVGADALFLNVDGINNTGIGTGALDQNISGQGNTAVGNAALSESTGGGNTAIGDTALASVIRGDDNIAVGEAAGINLQTGKNNIYVGNEGSRGHESGSIHIGTTGTHRAAFIAGISGATVPTGIAVIVDSDGHLGTTTSSARFKEAIKPMDKASEAILALKPVTFRYKHDLDPKSIPQFGLVAEEVEKVNPALVARDEQGKPYTVRYEAVNAMLLNEFLKEHRKNEQQRKDFEAAIAL
jgi:Chaperone of endosialidase